MQAVRRTAAGVVLLLAGCAALESQGGAPTLIQARSATYTGIYQELVTLKNGVYEGAPFIAGGATRPRVGLIEPGVASGDVGNDGRTELVVLLAESSGGSGDSLYLAVLAADGGKIRNLATALVGNRVQVRSLAVVSGAIVMETVEAGPDDAMCCPTAKRRRTWTLGKKGLEEATAEPQGTVSLADLEGRVWTLASLSWKDPLPAGVTVTAEFTTAKAPAGVPIPERFDGSAVGGNGGCNRYRAGVKAGDGAQSLVISPVAATRMACEGERMKVEDAYFRALAGASSFSFMPGNRLALTYRDGEATRALVFVAPEK
jgi:heat shock protein HslJ